MRVPRDAVMAGVLATMAAGLVGLPATAAAQPVPVTPAIAVVAPGGPGATLDRRNPAVGMAADGHFVAAYVEELSGSKVWVQRFAADGSPIGARVDVDVVGGIGLLQSPEVAMAADGTFVVAYERRSIDGSEQHVEFRRFDASAAPQGAAVIPGPAVSVSESAPDVGLSDDGRIAIAWLNIEEISATNTWRIRYRAYGTDGNPRFAERDASPEEAYDRAEPSLAMAPDGRFVLTWERRFTFMTTRDVPARRFDADGEPVGDVFNVFSGAVGGASGNGRPAAGIGSSGAFAVAWEGASDTFDAGVTGQLFAAPGPASGPPFAADELDAKGLAPGVVVDDDGTLFAAYECYSGSGCPQQVAYLREYAPDGTPRGSGVAAGPAIFDGRIYPEVASDRKGHVVVTWSADANGSILESYVRRYNATPPPPPPPPAPDSPGPVAPAPIAAATPPPPALACEADKLVLTDVYPLSGRTHLLGAAPSGSAGRLVQVVSGWDGKQVATATVQADLTFTATAPLPPRSLRSTNKARYTVRLDARTSAALKFSRRMYTTQLRVSGAKVTFAGSVIKPLARPVQAVTLVAAGSCAGIGRGTKVASVKPSSSGRFSASFSLPAALRSAPVIFLRAQTRVPERRTGGKTFPTFTLIRSVRAG